MRMSILLAAVGLCAVVVSSAGCDKPPKGTPRAKVQGKVTLDGKPMESGDVIFEGKDGGAPAVIPVQNGVFAGEAVVGPNTVRVAAYKEVPADPKKGPGYDQPQRMNIVDPKFNVNSQETKEVTADGANEFNFTVTSVKK